MILRCRNENVSDVCSEWSGVDGGGADFRGGLFALFSQLGYLSNYVVADLPG